MRYTPWAIIRGRPHGERTAEAGVRARVGDDLATHPDDRAVALAAELHVLHLPAPVRHRDQVLGAGLDPLHRPLQPQRGRDRDGVLGREPGLAAERAADVRRDDAHLLGVEVEHRRDAIGEAVRHLGGDVDGEVVPGAVVARDHRDRAALHRHHRDALVLDAGPHHDVGTGQRIGGRTGLDRRRRGSSRAPRIATAHPARGRLRDRRRRAARRTRRSPLRPRRPPRRASRPPPRRPRRRRTAPCRRRAAGACTCR